MSQDCLVIELAAGGFLAAIDSGHNDLCGGATSKFDKSVSQVFL